MNLVTFIQVNKYSRAAVLNLAEFSKSLDDKSKRNIEKEGFKYLLNQLILNGHEALTYLQSGKPVLLNRKEHISLSHSHEKLAVIVNETESTGIDIELIRDKVVSVRHKFLNDHEVLDVEENDVEKTLVYWAAKETIYKIRGDKEVSLKDDIFIHSFVYISSGGNITGQILDENKNEKYLLKYCKFEDYILVYMLNSIQ